LPQGLQVLHCWGNQITSLPPLPAALLDLNCGDNQLTSLPILPVSLKVLKCYSNLLTNIPFLPDSLKQLSCSFNFLSALPILPTALVRLDCWHNQITSLPILPSTLKVLICSKNPFGSLPNLPNNLDTLKCSDCELNNLPLLPSSLKFLLCSYNQLTSLPTLPNFLIELDCTYNQISSLPSIPGQLIYLYCNNNQLTNIPDLPVTLKHLYCNSNHLTSLTALPDSLEYLNISFNQIVCLTNLPYVQWFSDISFNQFSCVPNQTSYSLGFPLCFDNDILNNPNNCQANQITGHVFQDQNLNCQYENADYKTEHVAVKLLDTQNNLIATNYTFNGQFGLSSQLPDSFQVFVETVGMPYSMACGQLNVQNIVIDSVNQSLSNINFPIDCSVNDDISLFSMNTSEIVFPGQTHLLNSTITTSLNWYNLNCNLTSLSGSVSIQISGPVTYISPGLNALTPTVVGNTFTYNVADFSNLTSHSFGLQLLTDTTAQANDQICVHVEINPTPLDADTTNNVYDFCYQVVNSYDPNMKEVYPVNVLPGYDDWFTYTIQFQNTGNAPAFNIRLKDTLDANLDINSFEVRGYSHPAQISINGNILTVRFNNIMLPDSTSDFEGSMGYFQYRLKPLPNLPNGTQIENTAYIYFDYNAPIITNTTQNNFDMTVRTKDIIKEEEEHYVLYPNPSAGIFLFKDNKSIKTVEVFNMMGELLILSQGNAKIINLQAYPKGIYVARVNGTQVCRLVKE
jgi:uncharacterized repeat protein (TIGR01451 family)